MQHRMHVVIGGYGRVGRYLAHMLEFEGHSVAVIDQSPLVFDEDEGDGIIGTKHVGTVFDRDIMEQAGIERADCFAAVTSGDNSNIVSARNAKEHYRVPRVIARIYDPKRAEIYRGLGISTISSVKWTSAALLDLITHPEMQSDFEFGSGEVRMMRIELPVGLEGHTVGEIDIPGELQLGSLVRDGRALLPTSGLSFEKDDVLYINVLSESTSKLERLLGLAE